LRHLKPDFKTIADFRSRNCHAFRKVFRQFVLLCRELDLFGRELLAIDGTRIKAVNNKDRNFTRASLAKFIKSADAALDDYLQRLDQGDATESGTAGSRVENLGAKIAALRQRRERYAQMQAASEQSDEDRISLTDPDSRAMAAHTRVAVGYNAQIAVDAKHKLIVEQQVTNQVLDMGQLTETAVAAKDVLGVERTAATADKGYLKIEDIEACEAAGIDPYAPRPQRGPSVRAGLFRKDEFRYDPDNDTLLCPSGQRLRPYSSSLMRRCGRSTTSTRRRVRIVRSGLDARAMTFAQCRGWRMRRCWTGWMPEWRGTPISSNCAANWSSIRLARSSSVPSFLMRRLRKVRAEFSLTALAYNLRRVLNIVEFTTLMAAVQG
jgi:hypothetical protein